MIFIDRPTVGIKTRFIFCKTGMIQKEVGIHLRSRQNNGKKKAGLMEKAMEH
jgi:hypothetical protein